MGRIKKVAGQKHEMTVSPAISEFVSKAVSLPLLKLPLHLETFPRRWPFPRGDLYHWIPLFNRFDNILEAFTLEYGLQAGPQTRPFGRILLAQGIPEENKFMEEANKLVKVTSRSEEELEGFGYGTDGDRQLVESILAFTRILLENCGNRSLYNSSDRLGDLMNTTDLSLLKCTLHLAVRLAQRYYASRQRGPNSSQSINNALLASHYNIDLEKVQKLANPFIKPLTSLSEISEYAATPVTTPTAKGKEKAQPAQSASVHPSDLLAMAKDEAPITNGAPENAERMGQSKWEDWGSVFLNYYQNPAKDDKKLAGGLVTSSAPSSPTPVRRASGLSRPTRLSTSEDMAEMVASITPIVKSDDPAPGGMKTIEISYAKISSTPINETVKSGISGIPKEYHYELLNKVRIANALSTSLSTRQQMIGIRLLAITNLAYIYPDATFQQKILQPDSDEPRRLQLAYQLTDLIHPPGNRAVTPIQLQTLALETLEAFTKHKSKAPDVCAALNINVNHGVLFYALRKVVADLQTENAQGPDDDEWRTALFSLLDALPATTPRTGEALIAAGLLDLLLEVLTLRTNKAERCYPVVLAFLNNNIYAIRDAFQTFANSKGLDTISDLIAYEVRISLEHARNSEAFPEMYRTQVIDYRIPFFQQQTLRWLFKFVNHMMSHGNGNFDRLLRNLIDNSELLNALHSVILNAKVFGSSVWSGAVNIMSSFIHNEPTSYTTIAEAGLSKGLLEAITSGPIVDSATPVSRTERVAALLNTPIATEWRVQQSEKNLLAQGILPATDAIVTIPQAFGAICLNNPGMDLFLATDALEKFFEIFESTNHVKSMNVEGELARLLGSSFDELVRHHPRLKESVMISVMQMVARVEYLCRSRGQKRGLGAKLWAEGKDGELIDSADAVSSKDSDSKAGSETTAVLVTEGEDVFMTEAPTSDVLSSTEAWKETEQSSDVKINTDNDDEKNGISTATFINVAMKFLVGFFENSALCAAFIEIGGVEYVLDFATLPSLQYDFNNQTASQEIARVIHMLAEQKPHLVLPSLVKRTQTACSYLEPFLNHTDGSAFFSAFTSADGERQIETDLMSNGVTPINGTELVMSLVHVHTLCNILYETFSQPIYNSRNSHTLFSQVNMADMYAVLIKSLGQLHRACVWEEILLQKSIPESWKEATRTRGYLGADEVDVLGFFNREEAQDDVSLEAGEPSGNAIPHGNLTEIRDPAVSSTPKKTRKFPLSKDEKSAQFKNVRTLRYLLSQIPASITPFFQGLGKSLIAKRRPESYSRQNALQVSVAMSEANLEQLRFDSPQNADSSKDRYAYLIVILTSISQLLIEGPIERPHSQCLTLVLQAFKDGGGLDAIKELLRVFFEEVSVFSNPSNEAADEGDGPARLASAYGGIKIILNFFTQIITPKSIIEASQTIAIASYDRERGQSQYFCAQQFLVELRMAVLPIVRSLWDSNFVDRASGSIVKCLIEILRIVLDGSEEIGAHKRGEKPAVRGKSPSKPYSIHNEKINYLKEKGYDLETAREALYRCMNVQTSADEYCLAQKRFSRMPRNPIPAHEQEKQKVPSTLPTPRRQDSDATIPESDDSDPAAVLAITQQEASPNVEAQQDREEGSSSIPPPPPAPGAPAEVDSTDADETDGLGASMSIDNLINPENPGTAETPKDTIVYIDDLNKERDAIRANLMERALDVLNIHEDVTFELADLINAAALKAKESVILRKEIGETLVQSLISFQTDGDFRSSGKKIAAYANLLGLVLQDREFYEATLETLKANFSDLLKFIKIFPDQSSEPGSPWIGQILLIVEKILAEDVQPSQVQWPVPNLEGPQPEPPIVELEASLLSMEDQIQLFNAIVEILPRICKDESLSLSVIRTLVILTRYREIANMLAEKRNIQRLFVMVKQLAGITNERVQSSFMLLLRHIIEDDDTIRQIMRSEILANFEARPGRNTESTTYVRQMFHLVLRSPSIFVAVTNELLEIRNYDKGQRTQILSIKPEVGSPSEPKTSPYGDDANPISEDSKKAQTNPEENVPNGEENKNTTQKPKSAEIKPPVVEHPSGVIHYLLHELLAYKDVEDKEQPLPAKESNEEGSSNAAMANGSSNSSSVISIAAEPNDSKKVEKPTFKADQHPIYIYRCFILQCLAELLRCYNRTKVEFINFSRKADPKAVTPSKPRSGVLNYLLNELIPVGTLNHDESISHRKRSSTSNWAMSAIVSLCLRTNEFGYEKKRGSLDEEYEVDLLFVRKFVLEHALKAYKDANSSEESLDVKYARLLSIADLFNRMLSGKYVQSTTTHPTELATGLQMALAKLMFEKNFILALTVSIADIDLNFPGSKRAVKYILRPLKQLTSTAIMLSESIAGIPGQTDDDEISTATSVSEEDDEREETPDLFRNSTLGMFEPGREEESTSESSEGDEEMYDDEYDEEGMEYGDGMERDGDDVISDEEEEIEGVGHIEGLHGDAGMDVELVMEDDDDEQSDDDEDQDESEDDMDEDEDVVDEITGDSENDSAGDGWQDEGEEGGQYPGEDGLEHDAQDHESAVRELVRGFAEGAEIVQDDNEYMNTVIQEDDDDDAEDDDDEEDGDVMYSPGYEDEEPEMPDQPWGWGQDDEEIPVPRHHRPHHHPRQIPSPWTIFPTASLGDQSMLDGRATFQPFVPTADLDLGPAFRSHRPSGVPRTTDDGINPLLQRGDRTPGNLRSGRIGWPEAAATMSDYWVHGMEAGPAHRSLITSESPVSFVNTILSAIGQTGSGFATMGGPHGQLHFHVGAGARGIIPRELQAVLGLRPPIQEPNRVSRDDSMQPVAFLPASTFQRWQEEARILFGSTHVSKAERIINSLLRVMVPPAVEREHKKQLEEAMKTAIKEKERVLAEQAAKEKAEKEALEKKEQAERDAAAAAEAAAQAEATAPQATEDEIKDADAMEGVEPTLTEEASPPSEQTAEGPTSVEEPAGPSEPTERVRTTIRGRELDITGMGVDLEYLDALPEDLREEVLMTQITLQRSQAAAAGEEPTDINREFLEALPPDIREELLQQEASDRRRREREEARERRGPADAAAARAEEMDPASFLASLDPTLRQAVLMEQDEEVLAHLPQAIAAEARALGGDRMMPRFGDLSRLNRTTRGLERDPRGSHQAAKKPQRKQIVQMLDKAGVATLLRLMFIPQQGSSRQSLNGILLDVSQNRQNRAEVVSLLLSVLQDGSADFSAVERSFAHLSLRAKPTPVQKTPPLKRALSGQVTSTNNVEMTPLMVIQQCLSALVSLTQYNHQIPSFFLTEHEISSGLKSKSSRKGKGKESKASKYALNALLSLLDRKLIMESSTCMEQLSSLLESVTHPLAMLLRKEKDKPEEPKKVTEVPSDEAEADAADAPTEAPVAEGTLPPALEDISSTTNDVVTADSTNSPMPDAPAEIVEETPGTDLAPNAGSVDPDTKPEEAKEQGEKVKKPHTLTPPVVPEENLRLVVTILAARECTSKTFRDTLSTINNLSAIPEAKKVFGQGLIEQAQDLAQSILGDLDELVPQIQEAESGADIQGLALTKFSPASSDQAKLLRVLTALDYLFDPKRNGGKTKPAEDDKEGQGESSHLKEDLLTTLYENPTFKLLWSKLSDCLSVIRQGEGMLNVASILLPLIEALMVVCKNTTIKDAPLMKIVKDFSVASPPPESRMENLFFRFTEDHRKILNDLVRHNPKLMSGTFSLLVKNPKVLEFDNKRNYFTRRLHSRGTEARHPQPPLQLSVRRDQVFLDSFKFLSFKNGDEIKYGKLSIRFHGEEGVDAGGVTREWFQVLSRQMFNPDYALFIPVASDRTTFHPNKLSKVNEEHLQFFKFIGRIIGKALYEGRALDCHFSRAVYKRILGKSVSIKDMETLDLDYYKSLLWMLENDITEIITETFSVETDDFGVTQVVELVENGHNIPVTEENKHEYVQRIVEYRLTGSVEAQLEEFLKGFHDVVPAELIAIFNEQELELLISGLPDIDVDDWRNNTEYHNYSASSAQIQWFWRAVRSFDKEERAKLLQFVTGTSKVPLNGFSQLEGMNGFSRFNIHRDYGNKDRLPSSHTCFNQLDLPEYESYEILRQQVYTAMTAGSEYFGFA